jgi:putative tryptophan/tyrosine transport system substrate-binding protein
MKAAIAYPGLTSAVEQAAGSHPLAAAAHRERSPRQGEPHRRDTSAAVCREGTGRTRRPPREVGHVRRVVRLGTLAFVLALIAAPPPVEAQQPPGKTTRIGYLSIRSGPSYLEEAFRHGLRELGYVEGQNITIEYRWANFKPDRASTLAAELTRLQVDAIVSTGGHVPAAAAKRATKTIPIVFTAGDAVRAGLVVSLDRPGGNLTGINLLSGELNAKRLDLLKAAVPGVSRVAVLANPTNPSTTRGLNDLEAAARGLRVKLQVLEVRERQGIDVAFGAIARERTQAVLVMNDPLFDIQRERIVDLAAKHRLPGIFEWREFAEAGGLMSYGTNLAEMYRRLATYVDKILKGAKPGDLPVEQPTKFELVINLRTASALGLTIPQSVLLRADQVIQ